MLESYVAGFELSSILLVVATLLLTKLFQPWKKRQLPPCPAIPLPLVGHFPYLGGDIREKMLEFSRRSNGIFSLYFGSTRVIVLSSFTTIKQALVKQGNVFSGRPIGGLSPILDIKNGIGSASGEVWKENRSAVISILRQLGMGKNLMAERVSKEVEVYMSELTAFKGQPIDIDDLTVRATSNIICTLLMGKRYKYSDDNFKRFIVIFKNIVRLLATSSISQFYPQVKYLPGDLFGVNALWKADRELLKEMKTFIDAHLEGKHDAEREDTFISLYMKERERRVEAGNVNTFLTVENLQRVMSDVILGGSATVATVILWFYVFMLQNPDVQAKMYEEICREVGTSRAVDAHDRRNLKYVTAVMLETERLASIAPLGLFHRCTEDTTIEGYFIPKDSLIMPHQDAVLLNDDIWGDARVFRPERFLVDGVMTCPEEAMSYGIGKRACAGEAMSRLEVFIFGASVVQRFHLLPEEADRPPSMEYDIGLALTPKPFKMRFVERRSD